MTECEISKEKFANEKYITDLKEIDDNQVILLKRKARLLEDELTKTNLMIHNSHQNDILVDESVKLDNKKIIKNFQIPNFSINHILLLTSIIFVVLSVNFIDNSYSLFSDTSITDNPMKSKFVIENLRGDTIDTMKSWRILPDDSLNVNLFNADLLTTEQYNSVVKVLTSMDSIELDDSLLNKGQKGSESTYYLGWAGAMTEAKKTETAYTIPAKYNIIQSFNGEGHIIIMFSNLVDVDGYSGYTRSVLQDGEILKSHITIYDIENLEPSELATILRHEFGHALGLGHSTDPEDLMAPAILTDFPFISECNVDAIKVLYNGHESGMAVCKK